MPRIREWRKAKRRLERAFPDIEKAAQYAGISGQAWRGWNNHNIEPNSESREKLCQANARLDAEHTAGASAIAYCLRFIEEVERKRNINEIRELIRRVKPKLEEHLDLLIDPED